MRGEGSRTKIVEGEVPCGGGGGGGGGGGSHTKIVEGEVPCEGGGVTHQDSGG